MPADATMDCQRESSHMSDSRWEKWTLLCAGTLAAVAIGGFLVAVLIMGNPSHRGMSRSTPHSTTQ